jgi:hypothetical protein
MKFTKQVEINAVQFTGHNWKTVQDFVGTKPIDPTGKYTIPAFDEADTWMPQRANRDYDAVLNVNGAWTPVYTDSWLVREENGALTIMRDEDFKAMYGEPVAATKKRKR